jgi:hypothetical protein
MDYESSNTFGAIARLYGDKRAGQTQKTQIQFPSLQLCKEIFDNILHNFWIRRLCILNIFSYFNNICFIIINIIYTSLQIAHLHSIEVFGRCNAHLLSDIGLCSSTAPTNNEFRALFYRLGHSFCKQSRLDGCLYNGII